MIVRLILPMVKKYWKILLSTLIVSALGCAVMTGLSSGHLSLKNTLDDYIEQLIQKLILKINLRVLEI